VAHRPQVRSGRSPQDPSICALVKGIKKKRQRRPGHMKTVRFRVNAVMGIRGA